MQVETAPSSSLWIYCFSSFCPSLLKSSLSWLAPFWISMSDGCLLAGGGFHPFFVVFATTAFGGGGDDLDKLELCLDLLVDFLD